MEVEGWGLVRNPEASTAYHRHDCNRIHAICRKYMPYNAGVGEYIITRGEMGNLVDTEIPYFRYLISF